MMRIFMRSAALLAVVVLAALWGASWIWDAYCAQVPPAVWRLGATALAAWTSWRVYQWLVR
jgi:hypothetical protein